MLTYKIRKKINEVTPEWEDLIKDSQTATVFQTRAYLKAWLETFIKNTDEIFLVEIYNDSMLVAIAPLRKKGRKLTFLGTDRLPSGDLVTDFGDLVIKKNFEEQAWKYILSEIVASDVKEIELDYLRENSPSFKTFHSQKFNITQMLDNDVPDVSPSMTLPGSWDEYLSILDRKARHELKRKFRRLESVSFSFSVALNPLDNLPEFFRLHKASTLEKDTFMSPLMERFFTQITTNLGREVVQLMFLKIEDVNVAATISFLYKGEYWLYNSGFDRNYTHLSVGFLLKAQTIRWAIENKFKKYNFLRGNERYKYELGAEDERLYKVKINF
mgnify:CR=1 FL=1